MSYQAQKAVIERNDLSPSQKAVAFVMAFHANKELHECYPSMATIAAEAGFDSDRGARKVIRDLERKGVILAVTPKTGGRGRDKATVYRVNMSETRNTSSAFAGEKPGTNLQETRNGGTEKAEQIDTKPGTSVPPNIKELKRTEYECEQQQNQALSSMEEKQAEQECLERLWNYYLNKLDKNPLSNEFTIRRLSLGKERLRECLAKTGGNLTNAEKLMQIAIDNLANSDFHMGRDPKSKGRRFDSWEGNLFSCYERMENWWNAPQSH